MSKFNSFYSIYLISFSVASSVLFLPYTFWHSFTLSIKFLSNILLLFFASPKNRLFILTTHHSYSLRFWFITVRTKSKTRNTNLNRERKRLSLYYSSYSILFVLSCREHLYRKQNRPMCRLTKRIIIDYSSLPYDKCDGS